MGAICVVGFAGRLELPKPAGALPRSVAFPWASQVRGLLPERCDAGLPAAAFGVREEFGIAEGGRFCDGTLWPGTFCRRGGGDEFGIAEGGRFCDGTFWPGTFCRRGGGDEFGIVVARPFTVGVFCADALCAGAFGVPAR
jgi:hypothetical protein